jgi:hypothetical protein
LAGCALVSDAALPARPPSRTSREHGGGDVELTDAEFTFGKAA